jgi:hypothetical protein
MPDFGIFRGFNDKLFGDKLYAGQLPINLGLIGSQIVGIDPDAAAFFVRVNIATGTVSGDFLTVTEKTAINNLVISLKSNSLWTPMKAIYPMVGGGTGTTAQRQAACSQNLKSSSFTGTFTATGWTFASTGVTPNGLNGHMDTNLTPSSSLTQDSTHLSYYSRTNIANQFQFEIGCFNVGTGGNGSSSFGISYASPANTFRLRISSATPTTTYTVTDSRGFFIGNRTNATQQKIYNAGVLVDTFSANSDGLSTIQIALAANRIAAAALGDYSTKECAFASIGDGLTDPQAASFYTAVDTFQTTLLRNV